MNYQEYQEGDFSYAKNKKAKFPKYVHTKTDCGNVKYVIMMNMDLSEFEWPERYHEEIGV